MAGGRHDIPAHHRYVTFQMVEVMIDKGLFTQILFPNEKRLEKKFGSCNIPLSAKFYGLFSIYEFDMRNPAKKICRNSSGRTGQ